MSLLDEINATNESQIIAIEDCIARLTAGYKAELAELKHARSILVGRRKRVDRELANGQAELPFEPASAVADHLAQVEREAEEEGDAAEHRLAQAEREAEGEDEPGRSGWDLATSRPLSPEEHEAARVVPTRRRKGVAGG